MPDPISGPTLIASKMDSNPMFAPLITRAIYAGTQPIDAKGMAVTRQISLRLLLVLVLLFGLALMFAGMAIPHEWAPHILLTLISELGIAFVAASLLGFTIHKWMTEDLLLDAFKATTNYFLPEILRDEMRRILLYKFICERHFMIISIESIEHDRVRVTTTIERTIRNITTSPESCRMETSIDEWGFDERSRIEVCEIRRPNGETIRAEPPAEVRSAFHAQTPEIMIGSQDTVDLLTKFIEIRRANDAVSIAFVTPTRSPEILLRVPHELHTSVSFGPIGEVIEEAPLSNRYILRGVYFPTAHMRVRWWPREEAMP